MRAFLIWLAAALALAAPARAFETAATSAWVYDVATGTVLMEKNADVPLPPASMSKLMTLTMLFEALHDGRYTMESTFPVSVKAWRMGGSKMFVEPADRPSVEDLIHGIIVNSGNDACVVVAEGMAGSEEAFARQMTERAAQLGMTQTNLTNSSGWPDPEHRMSMHDLGVLAAYMIREFPELYEKFAMTEYTYKGRVPSNANNRNPLLRLGTGEWTADGLKTGHTQEAGYGLVGSAIQDGRRVVFVISGLESERARAEESERIVNWAFRDFAMNRLVPAGETVLEAPVWLGTETRVGLTTENGVNVLVPIALRDQVRVEVVYDGPIPAPIAQGDEVARLVVTVPGRPDTVTPLLAASDVPEAGFVGRLRGAVMQLGQRAISAVTG
ncbi:D-alanyl-D-alanine carboxypeptidase [Paracoccus gahaiensis]|uniref:serine-type D-Ala-D-Ala carboxypeptidase n=1 Tax=Paracoccus gahaiensis TaxID=1706839 RepID=A0A4V5MVZ7_9RHOB|nr:D-alanyl-D-alanine carboxypeptidase family protein [Paracoccus gahaiensis]TJZ94188.1 D-alanyl-D-alanine carboxypeptidase [Paracoccus gahaiensis]